jgi:predicted phosphoribosyltransferase
MTAQLRFKNREQAGALLARRLGAYAGRADVTVIGLPRGGVPLAAVVAERLSLPLDIFLVRKLGAPGQRELAIGAVASGGLCVLQPDTVSAVGVSAQVIEQMIRRERAEIARREALFGVRHEGVDAASTSVPATASSPSALAASAASSSASSTATETATETETGTSRHPFEGRVLIVVDDGVATGATMWAAVHALRQARPARIVVAVPVGAPDTCAALRAEVDELVCLQQPAPFYAVGQFYQDFSEVGDDEVKRLLAVARRRRHPAATATP